MSFTKEQSMERMTAQTPWKVIVLFSLPLLIGNLFQQFYSMADAVIIGRLVGVKELAGVGTTGAMNFLVIGFAIGITSGFSVITAQRVGAGDIEDVKSSIATLICLCGIIAVGLTLISTLTAGGLLRLLNTPEDIFIYAYKYIFIIYAGLGATIYYNMVAGVLRALGDSKTPFYLLVASSILNVILDLVAILKFNSGVTGAALATVLSQLISAVACNIYAVKKYPQIRVEKRHFANFIYEAWKHIRIGLPMAMQFSITAVGVMILQAYLNKFGYLVIAGYTAASKVENLVVQPFSTLAVTMEVYCGQNYGAGRKDRIRQGIKSSLIIGMIAVVFASSLNVVFGRQMVALFLDSYDARIADYGYRYLIVIAIFFALLCGLQIMRSSLQGMGEALVPVMGGAIELFSRWGGCVVLSAYAGYVGVYLSTPLAWGLALSLLLVRYYFIMRKEKES